MTIGEKLLNLRKQNGLSQEDIAEKLTISRQTISKWETNQTVPELDKIKQLSKLYNVSYDYLINDTQTSGDIINMETISDQIDWTLAWSKKYPILTTYQNMQNIHKYQNKINELYEEFKKEFSTNDTDTVLILKDILYHKYKEK